MKKRGQLKDSGKIKCLIFRQCRVIGLFLFFSHIALLDIQAQDGPPFHKDFKGLRSPSSTIPSDDLTPRPIEKDSFYDALFAYDDAGILKSMENNLARWREKEEYSKRWNLQSTGLYKYQGRRKKIGYLRKQALKYADKRLSGEIKKADQKSTLYKIGQARKVLKANLATRIYGVKVRGKVRVLEGKTTIQVENPWVESKVESDRKGNATLKVGRSISSLKIDTQVHYQIIKDRWTATLKKELFKGFNMQIISFEGKRNDDPWRSYNSGQRLEFIFHQPF